MTVGIAPRKQSLRSARRFMLGRLRLASMLLALARRSGPSLILCDCCAFGQCILPKALAGLKLFSSAPSALPGCQSSR